MASGRARDLGAREQAAPTRNDIEEAGFLPAEIIPRPGEAYLDTSGWSFATTTKQDVRVLMKELLDR